MTNTAKRKLPLVIFAIGTFVATVIAAITLVFFNPPQCPSYAITMPQNTHCVVGANIGLGLYLFLATGIWVASNIVAVLLVLRNISLDNSASKKVRMIRGVLAVFVAGLATYLIASLFLGHISGFIRA